MIQANELRIGNYVMYEQTKHYITAIESDYCKSRWHKQDESESDYEHFLSECKPIPLTPEILEKCGFTQLPHFTVNNTWRIDIGRDKVLSVACIGTPNEMVFLTEEQPPKVRDIICLRNYDYDGKTYFHQLQNLYYALTGEELQYNP